MDELKLGTSWLDVLAPWSGTPTVDSFTLMYPGTGGPMPGYDPITNNATINLFPIGTNLSIRANSFPTFDFGSIAFILTGPTAQSQTDNAHPWSLFGDSGGSYTGSVFNVGAYSLPGTPHPANAAAGTAGIPATINFTTVNTVVITNQPPMVTLTNPVNAATFTAPATVTHQATASDNDGSVTMADGGWSGRSRALCSRQAFNVTGPWTKVVPPAASPYPVSPASSREFFRLQWTNP